MKLTLSQIIIKIFFKGKNFLNSKYRHYHRIYDGIRIRETVVCYEDPLNVKQHHSFVTKYTHLGKNVNFNGMKIYGKGKVYIGDNFHSGFGCSIITQNHNFKNNPKSIPYDNTYIIKDVVIKENVWLGNNVTLLPGTHIGEGVIVQAGSVVSGKIEPFSIIGGHPAKTFSKRNSEEYLELKNAGKFH